MSASVSVFDYDSSRFVTGDNLTEATGLEVNLQHGAVAYEARAVGDDVYELEPAVFYRPDISHDLVLGVIPYKNDSDLTYVALQSN